MHPPVWDLVCRYDIDRIILRAIDDEEVYLAAVAAPTAAPGVRLNALSAALDNAFAKTSRLALRPAKSAIAVKDEVIALVDTKWQQNAIATLDELRENRGLRPMPNVNRMRG